MPDKPFDPAAETGPYGASGHCEPANEHWAAKRRLAMATRSLIDTIVTTSASATELDAAAGVIDQQVKQLATAHRFEGRSHFEREAGLGMGLLGPELNPLDGRCNPVAQDLDIWLTQDRAYAKVNMGWAYEGPPNCVHGGFIAALFDQFLGVGQKLAGQPGFTGTLKVRYIKPTPIATDLLFEGWVERVEGRKAVLKAELKAHDVLTASCEGLFITVPPDVVEALKNRSSDT